MSSETEPHIDIDYFVEQWSHMNQRWCEMWYCMTPEAAERKAAELKQYNAPTRIVKVTTTTVREVME